MTGLRRALTALAIVGAVLAVLGALATLTSDHTELRGLDTVLGVGLMSTYIGTGLYAWWRRPANRVGALMTATGFASFTIMLTAANGSVPFTLGVAFGNAFLATAVHMLLAFPSGRVPTRAQRALVVNGYVLALVVAPAILLFDRECCGDDPAVPDNALLVADAPRVVDVASAITSAVAVVAISAIAVVLVRRWRAGNARERRAFAPVLLVGAVTVALLAITLAANVAAEDDGLTRAGTWAALAAFAALPFAFLTGLMRSRAWRLGAVTGLVGTLGPTGHAQADLRDAIAEALADPTLQVAFWLPESGRYVDADGHRVQLPGDGESARTVSVVERDGRRVGALVHDPAVSDDPELVRGVAAAAALALDNLRLEAELRARVDELRASRLRIVEVGLAERRRLERDLHDGAQQRLVGLALQLGRLEARLARPGGDADPLPLVELAQAEARAALEELRELARGIHPAVLTDRGLGPAIEGLATRASLPVTVTAVPAERLPAAIEAAVYFVVAEALTNVAKYAEATTVEVEVRRSGGRAVVEVRDDGRGGASPEAGTGLLGLADRVGALDGRLEVVSPPGAGTTVRAELPCDPA